MIFFGRKDFTKDTTVSYRKVIPSCPWYYRCTDPLYVGECKQECFDRYKQSLETKEGCGSDTNL